MKIKSIRWIVFFFMTLIATVDAADANDPAQSEVSSFLKPRILTGKICDLSDPGKVLFHFRRTATNAGSMVYVLREYTLPNGTIAARERVVYDGDQLLSYQLEDLQSGTHGKATVKTNAEHQGKSQIAFEFVKGTATKTARESSDRNTLINDMVGPSIVDHWTALTNGETINLRLVAISRVETVGFKLTQTSQTIYHGQPAVIIRMEPTSLIIRRFIDPLLFTVETAAPHRVFQYTGRTTPSIFEKGKWQDLDALTVFDW